MRRLPPWTVSGASSEGTSANNCSKPEASKPKRPRKRVKTKEKDSNLHSEEPERVDSKIREEAKLSDGPEMIQSVTGSSYEDFTVDDLLNFAQEYVQSDEDQTRKERESLSMSESMAVLDELSPQEGTSDPTKQDMLNLLLGPYFKKH